MVHKTHRLQFKQVSAATTSLNIVTLSSEDDVNNSVVCCCTMQYKTKGCEGSLSALMAVYVGCRCCGALFIHLCLGCLGDALFCSLDGSYLISVALYCLLNPHGVHSLFI